LRCGVVAAPPAPVSKVRSQPVGRPFLGTAGSAAQIYRESAAGWGSEPEVSDVPAGVAQFTTRDVAIRSVDERHNNIMHWSDYDRGGHFAAMEAPDLFVADIRSFVRDFR
jgi:hypothetical protein